MTVADIARARLSVISLHVLVPRDSFQNLQKLIECDSFAACEVDYLTDSGFRFGSAHVRGDNVCDIGEVARLLAVAVDDGLLTAVERADKTRDDARIFRARVLTRTEDVEVAQADSLKIVGAREDLTIVFADEFGDGVRRERIGAHLFLLRQRGLIAVGRTRSGVDDAFDTTQASSVKQREGRIHTRHVSLNRILDGARNGRNRRFMKDKLDIFESAAQGVFISQTRLKKINITANLFQILKMPRRKIINHAHTRPARRSHSFSDVRPDEPRAASD